MLLKIMKIADSGIRRDRRRRERGEEREGGRVLLR
jgi:hypothetical protein